jgi:hypothetical protein
MNDQQENLARVSAAIALLVMEFYLIALKNGESWHMEDLTKYVTERTKVLAPDSPGRILRSLKQRGKLNYEVLRSCSLYTPLPVAPKGKRQASVRPESERYGT